MNMKQAIRKLIITTGIISTSLTIAACTDEGVNPTKKIIDKEGFSTEYFVVNEDLQEYVDSYSLATDTNAPNGYLLDDIYNIGDIVKVTYRNDNIKEEKLVQGKELKEIKKEMDLK